MLMRQPRHSSSHTRAAAVHARSGTDDTAEACRSARKRLSIPIWEPPWTRSVGTTQAEAAYRRAIALDPEFAVGAQQPGQPVAQQGRDAAAEAAFRARARVQSTITRMPGTASANRFNSRGCSKRRWTHFATPCNTTHASATAHCNLGTLLFALDLQCRRARRTASRIALDPDYAPAHGNLGALLARSGCPCRRRDRKSYRDSTGAGSTPLADQPGSGAVLARPPCRGRGMLPQGADDAAGLCRRPWQSAVRAQLPA